MKREEGQDLLEDYFIEKIKKSGYPLEIEVSNLLDRDYCVFNTHYYFDEETKQDRDLDIYGMPISMPILNLDKKLTPLSLRTEVAIECKKSEAYAWFFYTRPQIPMSAVYMNGQFRTSVPQPIRFSTESFQGLLQYKCFPQHYDGFDRIAVAYDEIKKMKLEKKNGESGKTDSSGRKEIFEARNQLVKFTCYELHETFKRLSNTPKDSAKRELAIVLFPIIVFDGDIFEVSFDSGKPKLERKKHILLSTHYRCPYCLRVESYTIDIVHRSYFGTFLKALGASFQVVREKMLENKEELLKKARDTRIKSETEKGEFLFV